VLATEWPKAVPQSLIDLEDGSAYASPIVADVDGDDRSDVIFRTGGDLYAFSLGGSLLEGWPISGEGRSPSTPMLIEAEDQGLHLFVMGSHDLIGGTETDASSALRRYALPDAQFMFHSWPCYRHDFLGSSRQAQAVQQVQYEGIGEESFICYPNPAKGDFFTVRVMLANYSGEISVTLLNLEGEVVYSTTGRHEFPENSLVPFEEQIPTADLAPGIYLCRLVVKGLKDWESVRKVAVIK
jgi:hypothetical protein